MSSIIRTGGSNIDRSAELRGLSTDTKPTRANGNEVPHGSTWYNMDDSTKYMYNADNDTWYNIPNGGGGGTGDMQKSVYDPTNTVANAGGIDTYVETEIGDATTEIINTVNSNIGTISDNLIKDTVGWTNKNLLPITLSSLQEINTNGTWDDNVYTYRNITITVETDIYNLITDIKVNGANTAGSVAFKLTNNFVYQLLSEDKYYISDGVDVTAIVDGSAYISVERKKGESGESHYLSTNNENRSTKFTVDYATYDYYSVSIYIPNNSSINNAVFYPMIRRASISDATYEPYRSTVEDELNSIDSAIGTLNANLGIANSRITNLQNNKANISDLGTSASKNSTSVVTQSTDLVESGAVFDAIGWGNKNLLPNNGRKKGGTAVFTYNTDGTIQVTGSTDSDNSQFEITLPVDIEGDYYYSGCPAGGSSSTYDIYAWDNTVGARIKKWDGTTSSESDFGETSQQIKLVTGHENIIVIRIRPNQSNLNLLFKPMVSKNGLPYEPYHASVEDTLRDAEVIKGKNLVDYILYGCSIDSTGGITYDGSYNIAVAKVKNRVTYVITTDEANAVYGFFTSKPVPGSRAYNNQRIVTSVAHFTSLIDGYVAFRTSLNYTTPQLEVGTTATAYEPYYVPLKDVVPNKCDNSVIAPVENGTTIQKSGGYAVGSHFIRDGAFCTVTTAISSGESLVGSSKFTSGDVADKLTNKVTEATTNNPNITLHTTYRKVVRYGNVIQFKVRITLASPLGGGSDVTLFNIGYVPVFNYIRAYVYEANAEETDLGNICSIASDGRITTKYALQASTYNVEGVVIVQ